jgi:eukaryotic-like serine/threonine-protein kinase
VPDSSGILQNALAGHYTIERELGRGGMATVYLAHDLKHDRHVALKVLRPELITVIGDERFLREVRLTAGLAHPHILPVLDSGDAAGRLWYTAPYIPGGSLRDRLDHEAQLGIPEALRIAEQVAGALAHAHRQGIVHRDIKPENILLAGDQALVADFGLAKAVDASTAEKLTESGLSVGTPAYMSPEQAAGGAVDARTDLYALGCVVYEMLAGMPPFTGPSARAILARQAIDPVPPLRTVRPTVPENIARAVERALAKVPSDRFNTAAEFTEALEKPDAARGSWSETRVRRAVAILGLVVITSVLYGVMRALGAFGHGGNAAPLAPLEPQRIAVLYFQSKGTGTDLRYVSDGLTEGLIDSLRQVTPLEVVSQAGARSYRDNATPRDSIARALKVRTLVDGQVEQIGERFRVGVWLVDGSSGAQSPPRVFEGSLEELLPIQGELSNAVVTLLRERPHGPGGRAAAWVLVQRAQDRITQADSAGSPTDASPELAAAESLLNQAARLDTTWEIPILRLGWVAYRQSRVAVDREGPDYHLAKTDRAIAAADSVLTIRPKNPEALELRGTARYWRWLLNIEPDSAKVAQLLVDAKHDLEAATVVNPRQAGAWAALSHLYYQTSTSQDVFQAAKKAYEADPYATTAKTVVSRLFSSAYDMGAFTEATQACTEGQRRFPEVYQFVECRLLMLTTPATQPDPVAAWVLVDSVGVLSAKEDRAYLKLYESAIAAVVLARAGLRDSASRMLKRIPTGSIVDPTGDIAHAKAFAYSQLGDRAAAIAQLRIYLSAVPERRAAFAKDPGWWFRDIAKEQEFLALVRER